MEPDQVLQKRVRGMAVRILACIEHTLACHLEGMQDTDHFELSGSDLKVIRSEILNAAGDTTRSLNALLGDTPVKSGGTMSLSRDVVSMLNRASVAFVELDDEIPVFRVTGDFNLLVKIRDLIGTGIVYKNAYTCAGIDAVVDHLLPVLDKVQGAGIKIAGGDYKTWRNDVCDMYLDGLEE